MRTQMSVSVWTALTGLAALTASCSSELIANQTAVRQGNVAFQFVNTTPFRASFTYGTYDALDRNPPGAPNIQQLRLEGFQTTAPTDVTCARNAAIASQSLVDRVIDTDGHLAVNFDREAFNAVVNFSSADEDSDAAALPTEGTAEGVELLLGVDFGCRDRLIFTFVQDPAAPGGFRIDFSLLRDRDPNQL
jgi:hypothetical protein